MTSLQKQLARLAIPFIKDSLESRRASLLFSPNEVAGLDREYIFDTGLSGLEELININKSFSKYEKLLFDKNKINFERTQQTKIINQNINEIIDKFLIEVSPYFLMKCAQKSLEWLVYRYRINQFNLDIWLLTIMPYHYTTMFIRVLSIIDLSSSKKWQWLDACSKSGMPLPKDVLIKHCKKHPALLRFFCNGVDKYIEVYGKENINLSLIIGLNTVVIFGSLIQKAIISEELVSVIIQYIISAVKSKCIEWLSSGYMILSQLNNKVTINNETIFLLFKIISKNILPELKKEAICCLNILISNQDLKEMPDKNIKSLKMDESFLNDLRKLFEKYDIYPLISLLQSHDTSGTIKKFIEEQNFKKDLIAQDEREKVSIELNEKTKYIKNKIKISQIKFKPSSDDEEIMEVDDKFITKLINSNKLEKKQSFGAFWKTVENSFDKDKIVNDDKILSKTVYFIFLQIGEIETKKIILIHLVKKARRLFHQITNLALKQILVFELINLVLHTESNVFLNQLIQCIKKLKLSIINFEKELENLNKTPLQSYVPMKKKARLSKDKCSVDLKRIKIILEVLLSNSKVTEHEKFAMLMFNLLSHLIIDGSAEADYCIQLTLTNLRQIFSSVNITKMKTLENCLNIEILINCLHESLSLQIQHNILTLLTILAPLFPDQLFHNMVSIFTFMGTRMVKRDDFYSFQIFTKAIDAAIESIMKSTKSNQMEVDKMCSSLFLVFVDARSIIPKHRLIPLFTQLLNKVGPNEYLWKFSVFVVESFVRNRNNISTNASFTHDAYGVGHNTIEDGKTIDKDKKILNFAVENDFITSVYSQFPVETQINSSIYLIKFLQKAIQIMNEKEVKENPFEFLIDIDLNSPTHILRLIIFHLSKFLVFLLADKEFISEFIQRLDKNKNLDYVLEDLFKDLIKECIVYIVCITDKQKLCENEIVLAKFMSALLKTVYGVLDKIQYLLPISLFLDIVHNLLLHHSLAIRNKGLHLLNAKLIQIYASEVSSNEIEKLVTLVGKHQEILLNEKPIDVNLKLWNDTQQIVLLNLKLMSRAFAEKKPEVFLQVLPDILKILMIESGNNITIIDNALLCISDFTSALKLNLLPFLEECMISILSLLKNQKTINNDFSLSCVLSTLNRFIINLSAFLSPYLDEIISELCVLSNIKKEVPQIMDKLLNVIIQISSQIESRVLIPCILENCINLFTKNQKGLSLQFFLLNNHIKTLDKEKANCFLKYMSELFCYMLNMRNVLSLLTWEEVEEIEQNYVDTVLSFIFLLSEQQFRPFFAKLCDTLENDHNRILTFFHLISGMADKLKSIFNVFAVQLIVLINGQFNYYNLAQNKDPWFNNSQNSKEKACLMLKYLFATTEQCFLNDIDASFTSSSSEYLFQTIVIQLENFIGGEKAYVKRMTEELIPCIKQIALASKDSNHLQSLNQKICMMTRHSKPKVRIYSLKTIEVVAEALGNSYEVLFPETAPFIVELLEDDSEEVEKECQKVKIVLESILGDLTQFFN